MHCNSLTPLCRVCRTQEIEATQYYCVKPPVYIHTLASDRLLSFKLVYLILVASIDYRKENYYSEKKRTLFSTGGRYCPSIK